jgi:hypothetical protein
VQPVFTFTSVDPPPRVRVLDTGAMGIPPDVLVNPAGSPWVHQANPAVPHCGVNFVPDVQEAQQGRDAGTQCCKVVCHDGATATHCVVVSLDCSGCAGACCFPTRTEGRCHVIQGSRTETSQQRCESRGGTYGGHGTDCADLDADGLADVWETNNCCGPRDSCHLGTSPLTPDTDGDGFDGEEVKRGTDPCDPLSHP